MHRNPLLFNKLSHLIRQVLPLIEPAIKEKFLPTEISDYPHLEYNEKGFPNILKYPSRISISQFFYPAYQGQLPAIELKKFAEYNWLLNEFKSNSELGEYFSLPNKEKNDDSVRDFFIEDYIQGFIERYYYLHGTKFSSPKFDKIYRLTENYLYTETLLFDISVPILFLKFQPDHFKVNNDIYVRRISNEDHRARHHIKEYSPAIVDSVYMSATHELVLKNYAYKRQPSIYSYFHFSDPYIYPLSIIQRFFTILKLTTDYTSGFAQILVYPKNWAERFFADVKYVTGTATRSYPHYFENFYWNNESFPEVSLKQLYETKTLFNKATAFSENKVEIALRRFYKSMMRQEEEDIIIDLIIALELLLSDNEKNDIAYKLAIRLSVLICEYNRGKYSSVEVFENIKKIYDYRSAIVHGSEKRAKQKREIKLPDNTSIPAIELAKVYLREVLKIVIREPKHLDAKTNDLMLLHNHKGIRK